MKTNMKKTIIVSSLAATIILSNVTGAFASQKIGLKKADNEGVKIEETLNCFDYSKDMFKKDISKLELNKAKALYNKAIKFQEKSDDYWSQMYKLDIYDNSNNIEPSYNEDDDKKLETSYNEDDDKKLETSYNEDDDKKLETNYKEEDGKFEELSNDDFYREIQEELKEGLTEKQKKEFKDLFYKTMDLDRQEKFEEANKVWQEIDKKGFLKVYDENMSNIDDEKFADEIIDESKHDFDKFFEDEHEIKDIDFEEATQLKFEDVAKEFRKDADKKLVQKAKELFEKAIDAEKEANKAWKELDNMNVYAQ